MDNQKRVFFQDKDIQITDSRFVLADQAFALKEIKSIKCDQPSPWNIPSLVAILSGVDLMIIGISQNHPVWFAAAGAIFLSIGIGIVVAARKLYFVVLTTTDGKIEGATTFDKNYVDRLIAATNEAVASQAEGQIECPDC